MRTTHTYADLPIPAYALEAIRKALIQAGQDYVDRYCDKGGIHLPDVRLVECPDKSTPPFTNYAIRVDGAEVLPHPNMIVDDIAEHLHLGARTITIEAQDKGREKAINPTILSDSTKKENSLNPHFIWAVWDEDATEVLEVCFSRDEAIRCVPDEEVCHVAEYALSKSWVEKADAQ